MSSVIVYVPSAVNVKVVLPLASVAAVAVPACSPSFVILNTAPARPFPVLASVLTIVISAGFTCSPSFGVFVITKPLAALPVIAGV